MACDRWAITLQQSAQVARADMRSATPARWVSLALSTGPVVQVSRSTTQGRGVVVSVMVISLAPVAVLPGLYADPGDARARPLGHRSTAASGPHRRTVLVGAQEGVGRELRPPLGRVLPLLPPPVDGHVEQPERGTHHLVAPAGRPVRQVDLVLPPQVAREPSGVGHGGVVEV